MGRIAKPRTDSSLPQIQVLQDQHREMVRMMAAGMQNKEIAKVMGYTPQMVSIVRNSTVAREKLDNSVDGLHTRKDREAASFQVRLKKYADEALEVLHSVMCEDMTPEAVKVSAAKDFLDRAGHGAVKRLSVGIGILTPERISEIKERARTALVEDRVEEAIIDVPLDESESKEELSDSKGSTEINEYPSED